MNYYIAAAIIGTSTMAGYLYGRSQGLRIGKKKFGFERDFFMNNEGVNNGRKEDNN